MVSLKRFWGKGGEVMIEKFRLMAAAVLVALLGFLPVASSLAESGGSLWECVSAEEMRTRRAESYDDTEMLFDKRVDDVPEISDIYDEYDAKVIHSSPAGMMKTMQGTGLVVWAAGAFFIWYLYRMCFRQVRLFGSELSRVSCKLLILLEKDGKK